MTMTPDELQDCLSVGWSVKRRDCKLVTWNDDRKRVLWLAGLARAGESYLYDTKAVDKPGFRAVWTALEDG